MKEDVKKVPFVRLLRVFIPLQIFLLGFLRLGAFYAITMEA
jgi:hypothetical protein